MYHMAPGRHLKVISRRPSGEAYFMCAATLITPTVTVAHKYYAKNQPQTFHKDIAHKYHAKNQPQTFYKDFAQKNHGKKWKVLVSAAHCFNEKWEDNSWYPSSHTLISPKKMEV